MDLYELTERLISSIGRHIIIPDIRRVYGLRRKLMELAAHNAARLNDGHFDRYVLSSDSTPVLMRIYPPLSNVQKKRVILFFHGGGWVISNVDSYHQICRRLADISGSYVISVDYRLAPEYKFPKGLEDCYAAAKHVYEYASNHGLNERDIILMGDSAGGNMAASVALRSRERGDFRVKRQILLYPVTACDYSENSPYRSVKEKGTGYFLTAERMRGFLDLYLSDPRQANSPYVAPIKARSLEGMPDTLIITAENDPLRDEGEAYGKRLLEFGCAAKVYRLKRAYHGFFASDISSPFVKRAYGIIMYFIRLTDY